MSSLKRFGSFVGNEQRPLIEKALSALRNLQESVDEHGVIIEDKLKELFAGSKMTSLLANTRGKVY